MLVAHYYVDGDLQDLALATGGLVADSLEMARFGREHPAQTLVVAGVRFMGETSKILSPEKRVLMPDLDATCSLDLGCPVDEFDDLQPRLACPPGQQVTQGSGSAQAKIDDDQQAVVVEQQRWQVGAGSQPVAGGARGGQYGVAEAAQPVGDPGQLERVTARRGPGNPKSGDVPHRRRGSSPHLPRS